jgi:uncharacterized membrane protein YdjX (TVP38/TMEM64 family)
MGDSEGQQKSASEASGLPAWVKPVGLLAIVVVLIVVARVFNLGEQLKALEGWIDGLGAWAPLVFIAVYIGATVLAIPGTPLTVAAGALFGALWGVVYVSIASTLGACICFIVARYLARDAVRRSLEGKPKFEKLDRMTEKQGALIVAITRLVPIFPFNLLNYGFGLTRVRFWHYALVSWVCMIPGTMLYVIGPAAVVEGLQRGEIPWVLVGVFVATIVALVIIVKFARSRLEEVREETPGVKADKSEEKNAEENEHG